MDKRQAVDTWEKTMPRGEGRADSAPHAGHGAPLRVGVFVPQGWKLEYSGWEAHAAWERSVELARQAEELGYDHIWVYDHVETVPRREPTHVFEAFTMLAALSQCTDRVGLGQLVTCSSYRNAGLLAKEGACIDVYSGGRLILGLGAGWFHEEYASYGYRFLPARDRLTALEETVSAIRMLWSEQTVTFDGQHVHLHDAYCDPKPIQRFPPVWIGGGGEQVNLRIAARHADATNWQVGLEAFRRKSQLLERYCEEIGRPFTEITRTHGPDCRIFDTEEELHRWCDELDGGHLWGGQPPDEYIRENFVGTVDQVAEKAQEFVDAGARDFVLWMRDYPSDETLRRFIGEVVPMLEM
ncbi:MAG TPA: LLM class flavin-dependent oxidoreductase [Acidimicrobiales bacterium]|nr:LLM class flavin-dependent oxidoreductase [Acidimicrobiales bacterium]